MLDAGGGGGYGGTNWNGYDVRQMWSMLEGQQTDPHWKLVSGWRKTFELTSLHLSRLKDYRERLAEAWPPERNAASAAYVAHLDYLIGHVQQTYDAAVANYDAFSGATGAISTARYELKKVYDEYQANQVKLDDYDLQIAAATDPANSGLPQPAPGPPPVPAGRQEELNNRARSLMFSLSGELTQARAAIRQPPPYKPPPAGGISTDRSGYGGGSDVAAPTPPVIPPIVPAPAPPPRAPAPPAPVGSQTGTGPTLAGPGPITLTPPPGTINPVLPVPQPPTVTPAPNPGIIGPLPPTVTPVAKPTTGLINNPTAMPKPTAINPMALPKPMPPGGVIGPITQPVAGQPMAGRPAAQRINPVGGVIGPQSGPGGAPRQGAMGTAPTAGVLGPQGGQPGRALGGAGHGASGRLGASGAAPQPYGAAPGGRAPRRSDEQASERRWDPDNPWETDEGVDPVVLPPAPTGRVDPGPAIGFNR
jgi:hypothetical protein